LDGPLAGNVLSGGNPGLVALWGWFFSGLKMAMAEASNLWSSKMTGKSFFFITVIGKWS